jgi:hypothetical protein
MLVCEAAPSGFVDVDRGGGHFFGHSWGGGQKELAGGGNETGPTVDVLALLDPQGQSQLWEGFLSLERRSYPAARLGEVSCHWIFYISP